MNEEAMKVLQMWYQEERGNRVTSNNMEMLIAKLQLASNKGATDKVPQETKDEEDNGTPS